MPTPPPALTAFADELRTLGWVTDLLVGGSLAGGDHRPGVSDLDLVAIVDGTVDRGRVAVITSLHASVDGGAGPDARLGCVYVDAASVDLAQTRHPTWTHGRLVARPLAGLARAQLIREGYAVFGRSPAELMGTVSDEQLRRAARDELCGYWARAVRAPWWWSDPALAELALTTMARARHTLATGELLDKTRAIERVAGPEWLRDDLRARRRGEDVARRRWRTGWIAWRDARRTIARERGA